MIPRSFRVLICLYIFRPFLNDMELMKENDLDAVGPSNVHISPNYVGK